MLLGLEMPVLYVVVPLAGKVPELPIKYCVTDPPEVPDWVISLTKTA